MPHFYGRRIDNPYEFCKLCGIQRRPAGSTEEDYRLRALPFALKGEADTWFMRLPPNSIRTWSDFRSVFLEYFFPATRTNALKKEIQGATQEDDETLSQYWGRFKGMLDACPNNKMSEAEIYNNFYEGMTPECKDLVNSASGRDFSRLRVSEAKRILSRLIDAKKAYDSPRTTLLRRGTVNVASEQPEDRMEARMEKWRKLLYLPWKRPSRRLRPRSAKRHLVQRSRINFTIPSPKENTPRRYMRREVGTRMGAGTQGSNGMLPGETILILGGLMPI
ncbi:hypothetical protein AAHA92_29189 [Salvia divinorum]|uniref:Retrotransposon gag domain-containing protein n=1 Tax=Salvia divinorum TaxID=28513 RepID=A0ABD1FXK2_SALDI